jgi:hypothetical protein
MVEKKAEKGIREREKKKTVWKKKKKEQVACFIEQLHE